MRLLGGNIVQMSFSESSGVGATETTAPLTRFTLSARFATMRSLRMSEIRPYCAALALRRIAAMAVVENLPS
jgi:hypothetical protein